MYQSLQGNLGLVKAISYFGSHNIPVSIPLNDTQKYDLVADFNGKLYRVSVKTSRAKEDSGAFAVQLRNTGGNRTGTVRQVAFDKTAIDYLFIYTSDEDLYLIPSEKITVLNTITVGNKYREYIVKEKTFKEFVDELE